MSIYVHERAKHDYKMSKKKRTFSLVYQILQANEHFCFSDGIRITKVAVQCVDDDPRKRPTMKEVVRQLKALSIDQNIGILLVLVIQLKQGWVKKLVGEYLFLTLLNSPIYEFLSTTKSRLWEQTL